MLRKTIKRISYGFGLVLISGFIYTAFYMVNQPSDVSANNKFVSEVSFYKPRFGKDVQFAIRWNTLLKKDTAENKDNFILEQVKPEGINWLPVHNGKKFRINHIQYVYAPWVDTEEKRKKSDPSVRETKVTQVFATIMPKEEVNDYYKVTVKNIENLNGEKMEKDEYVIVKLDKFNNLIRR